jgi:hypothetical protein
VAARSSDTIKSSTASAYWTPQQRWNPGDRLVKTCRSASLFVPGGLAHLYAVETLGVSADQVIDVQTAVESSDLLKELPDLRVDDSDDDEPVLVRADGRPVGWCCVWSVHRS